MVLLSRLTTAIMTETMTRNFRAIKKGGPLELAIFTPLSHKLRYPHEKIWKRHNYQAIYLNTRNPETKSFTDAKLLSKEFFVA